MAKNSNKKSKNSNKYNAENEIIIGVTTKPKEKVRVEKNTTRTNAKPNVKKDSTKKRKTNNVTNTKSTKNKKSVSNKNKKVTKNIKSNKETKRKITSNEITKEEHIRKTNAKKIMVSIIVLLFISLGGTIYYLTTPVFNISNVEVYGNEKNSVETYISLSKINVGNTNIFAVTENRIKNNLKENSYVEDVTIKRRLPNVLEINIVERKVEYQIKYSNNYIYLDDQGHILEISEEKQDVPNIDGFYTIKESVSVGQRLIQEDLVKLNIVAKIINYCKYNTIENKITDINVADDANYILYFKKDKKTVYLGDASNLSERLRMLKTILKNEKNKGIEIFMNGDVSKDDVYIRYAED